jgi:hypothetical protein
VLWQKKCIEDECGDIRVTGGSAGIEQCVQVDADTVHSRNILDKNPQNKRGLSLRSEVFNCSNPLHSNPLQSQCTSSLHDQPLLHSPSIPPFLPLSPIPSLPPFLSISPLPSRPHSSPRQGPLQMSSKQFLQVVDPSVWHIRET